MPIRSGLNLYIILTTLIVILLVACSPNAGVALPTPTRLPLTAEEQEKAGYIDDLYTQMNQEDRFSGSVLVEMNGKIIFDKGYGYADRQEEILNTLRTRFRLFNASKVFTAIGVMLLEEQGALGLGDLICQYLSDCPAQWGELTVTDLLNGNSGLHDYTMVTSIKQSWGQPIDRESFHSLLKSVSMDSPANPLAWEGASDYALLGLIIEAVSGETYADFMHKQVIEPIGLTNTGFVQGTGEADDLAVFYQGSGAEPAGSIDMSNLVGYGSAYSSAEDLYLLIRALREGDLLSAEKSTSMFEPNEYGIGYGWQVFEFDERTWITNNVGFPGVIKHATLAWYDNGTMAIVVLSNQQDLNLIPHPQHIVCLPGSEGFPNFYDWVYAAKCY